MCVSPLVGYVQMDVYVWDVCDECQVRCARNWGGVKKLWYRLADFPVRIASITYSNVVFILLLKW